MSAMEEWSVAALSELVHRAYPFSDLGPRALESTLDMLSGRYPSDEFAELRPRIVWDRLEGTIRGRAGAQRLAVVSGGTIPDRGLFSVNLLDDGKRVGELDEEMVYEMRPGETFVLGATTWRVADITPSQVMVTPAPGEPGRIAFWHGDALGRPVEVGRALGDGRAGANAGAARSRSPDDLYGRRLCAPPPRGRPGAGHRGPAARPGGGPRACHRTAAWVGPLRLALPRECGPGAVAAPAP